MGVCTIKPAGLCEMVGLIGENRNKTKAKKAIEQKDWPSEERIDRIAASHGDGEHYEILDKQNKVDNDDDSTES